MCIKKKVPDKGVLRFFMLSFNMLYLINLVLKRQIKRPL